MEGGEGKQGGWCREPSVGTCNGILLGTLENNMELTSELSPLRGERAGVPFHPSRGVRAQRLQLSGSASPQQPFRRVLG